MNPPIPNQFDPANARRLCQASAEAYAAPANEATILLRHPSTDTRVLIIRPESPLPMAEGQGEGDLIVAFRGTADLRNWLTDLDCELTRIGHFRVHRGFYQAMKAVEADSFRQLAHAPGARLWVTGHSLGGALAMLWALWAAQRGHDVAGVYTFGQPRVGDAAFGELYNAKLQTQTWRVVYAEDVVPRVPWLLGHYRHAGHEVFFPSPVGTPRGGVQDGAAARKAGSSCEVLTPRPYQVDLAWWQRLPSVLRDLCREWAHGKLALLDDHHVRRYLALFPGPRAARCVPQT